MPVPRFDDELVVSCRDIWNRDRRDSPRLPVEDAHARRACSTLHIDRAGRDGWRKLHVLRVRHARPESVSDTARELSARAQRQNVGTRREVQRQRRHAALAVVDHDGGAGGTRVNRDAAFRSRRVRVPP